MPGPFQKNLASNVVSFDGFICDLAARRKGKKERGLARLAAMLVAGTLLFVVPPAARAQAGANSDPNYSALRNLTLGSEAVSVTNFELKRDAGKFKFNSGTVCFVPPVNGKVTGAVFAGEGIFLLNPPSETERKSLKLLTKEDEFNEKFERLVLRFTDSTYDEIKKAGKPASGGCDAGVLKDSQNATRHRLRHNLEAELLGEVLSPQPRGIFFAFIHGKHYDDKEIFEIDPNTFTEQVEFWTYDENKFGEWAQFHFTEPPPRGSYGNLIRIEHHDLDTTFEKSGALSGKATTTFVSLRNGLRVVPFALFPSLRVQSVTANGQALSFIQEDKHDDANYAVILPKPLAAGEKFTVTTTYSGKDAVSNEGGGNYFPIAREDWYPNTTNVGLGEYASYDMIFKIPKGMKIAATGVKVSDTNDGSQNITVWKSEAPQTVAGFNFGRFKVEEGKLTKPEFAIESYANEESPNWVQSLQRAASGDSLGAGPIGSHARPEVALGTMSTTSLNKKALAEGELAIPLYTEYFGPSLFAHLQITQQTACSFGQSWPELVWIPICYYFDTTVRHQLGMDWGDRGYWKVVTPHEVAHQWWGHTVGFNSGRDQWMSEGFAEMSASLYLSFIEKNPKKFITFWNDERELLLERNPQGYRAIDVGPLTMGYRASNSRTGFDITRRLIYPKGAYILHMIRMMMWSNQTADKQFKDTMHDFVDTYRGKSATTEDFKEMVEKHMTPEMDLEGNHKLDWFFNEYVYGTQLPTYKLDSSFDTATDGTIVMNVSVTQSGVDDKFRMLVPVYLELDEGGKEGKVVFLGRARLTGNTTVSQKVPLRGLKTKPRVLVNYYDDVLASPN
ncbi:MAG TPA: M1 family aminopeptidase [Candidatus Acidoferrum sp.]|nr:M1 family aminopeptidase [Candidatus Acidoferrum sp.]